MFAKDVSHLSEDARKYLLLSMIPQIIIKISVKSPSLPIKNLLLVLLHKFYIVMYFGGGGVRLLICCLACLSAVKLNFPKVIYKI